MAAEVASAFVSLVPTTEGFGSAVEKKVGGSIAGAGRKVGHAFGSAIKVGALGVVAGAALGGALLKSSISAASDLNENQSKVGVVFGKSAGQIVKASKTSAAAMGLSQNAYLGATGTLGNLLVSLDLGPKKAAGMSQQMVKLAGDLASFNNVSPEQALDALRSGLTGETEPLKAFGVNMNEATLKAEALSLGILKPVKSADKIKLSMQKVTIAQAAYNEAVKKHGKNSNEALRAEASLGSAQNILKKNTEGTIPPLTAQQKALAAQALIMKQTKTAQGDFGRTSAGLANQQRILGAQFTDAKTTLGKGFLPIAVQVVTFLTSAFLPVVQRLAGSFSRDVAPVLVKLADKYLPKLQAAFKQAFVGVDFKGVGASLAAFDFDGLILKVQAFWAETKRVKAQVSTFLDPLKVKLAQLDFGPAIAAVKGFDFGPLKKQLGSIDFSGFTNSFKSIDFGKLQSDIAGIDFSKVTTTFGKSASDSVSVFSVVIGFLARHIDTLAKYMPLLIGAFIAYKAATAASKAAEVARLPIMLLTVGANFALASSNRAVAAQMAITNGVEQVSLLTRIRTTVATVASTIASKAAAAASKVWAAGQWLLNAALTANPIGLIIVAIALLVGGFILAYKHSSKFRAIIAAIGDVVKVVAGKVVAFVGVLIGKIGSVITWAKAHWPLLLAILTGPIGLVVLFVVKHWDAIKAKTVELFKGIIRVVKGVPGRIISAFGNVGSLLFDKGKSIVAGLIDGIRSMAGKLAGFVKKFVTDHIPAPVAKALGIQSPSKVMAKQAAFIPLGMVKGIEGQGKHVDRAMTRLSSRIAVHAPTLDSSVTAGGSARAGGQELRGTLGIDRQGVAYIHGIAKSAVQTGKAAREEALRNEATGAVSFA